MLMLCNKCGNNVPDNAGRCPVCGNVLIAARPPRPMPAQPRQPQPQQPRPQQPRPQQQPPRAPETDKPKKSKAALIVVIVAVIALLAAGGFGVRNFVLKNKDNGSQSTTEGSRTVSDESGQNSPVATEPTAQRATEAREAAPNDLSTVSGVIGLCADALNAGDRSMLNDVLAGDDLLLAVMLGSDEDDAKAWRDEAGGYDADAMLDYFRPVCLSAFDYYSGGRLEITVGNETAAYDFGAGHKDELPLSKTIQTQRTDAEIEGETCTSVVSGQSYEITKALRVTLGSSEEIAIELVAVDDTWKVLMIIPSNISDYSAA